MNVKDYDGLLLWQINICSTRVLVYWRHNHKQHMFEYLIRFTVPHPIPPPQNQQMTKQTLDYTILLKNMFTVRGVFDSVSCYFGQQNSFGMADILPINSGCYLDVPDLRTERPGIMFLAQREVRFG